MKLTAKDLRLFNLIHFEDIEEGLIECQITIGDLAWLSENEEMFNEFHKAIPLTEEWLLRFGFESNPYQDRYENKAIHVECNKLRGEPELWIDRMPHIKYVHQLQNLYHSLMGEELTLNQNP